MRATVRRSITWITSVSPLTLAAALLLAFLLAVAALFACAPSAAAMWVDNTATAHSALPADGANGSTIPWNSHVGIQEDSPRWNCAKDGDGHCGPRI